MKKLINRIVCWFYPELRRELVMIKPSKPTKLDKYREYAENIVIESGIDLENVLVHNHGNWGKAGARAYKFDNYCATFETGGHEVFRAPLPLPENPYILVPEIKDSWTFQCWIHEIGHYNHEHYKQPEKPKYIKEYEAEKYCMDKCKESGIVDSIDMIYIKYNCVAYLHTHIDKAIEKGDIKYKEDIPQEMYDFIYKCDYMKEEMEKKNLPSKEELNKELELMRRRPKLTNHILDTANEEMHRKFDRYYR